MKRIQAATENLRSLLAILMCLTLAVGCSARRNEVSAESGSGVAVDWEQINAAISSYDFDTKGYYIGDFEEEEAQFNQVIVTNYDDSVSGAFREVDYQLTIAYGETMAWETDAQTPKTYETPMIELSLLSNSEAGDYGAIYSEDGTLAEESGAWFLPDDQAEYMQRLLSDAQEMFGLSGAQR